MIDFYNAFISYKHAPLDSKVAEHVQRNLERFHIPHAISKNTGRKKIERVFRDKDELPITSDLTDTISNALEKAEYLIVICSPRTKESVWVDREIKYFLKSHDRNRILTVLAEGEPMDVIPSQLLYEEKEVTEYNGFTHMVKTAIEPLSCDYRMPLSRAKKEELPRLAAALIGCSYDELVRRQRQYQLRRVVALSGMLVAATAVFAWYMTDNMRKINNALTEAYRSQSIYLAGESERLLEDDRRVDAIQLALAAVSRGEGDQRTVTGEAIAALTNATLAYRNTIGLSIDSVWDYALSNEIIEFAISDNGTRLAALDKVGTITIWNTETHSMLGTIDGQQAYNSTIRFSNNDYLLCITYGGVTGYDADSGEELWNYRTESRLVETSVMEPSPGYLMFGTNDLEVISIDCSDGSELAVYDISNITGFDYYSFGDMSISPDGTKIAFDLFLDMDEAVAGVYDINTGSVHVSDSLDAYISAVGWADNDHIIVSTNSVSDLGSSIIGDSYYFRPETVNIYCFNPANMNTIWTSELVGYSVNRGDSILPLPANNAVAYSSGNVCNAYDINTGEILYSWTASDSLVDISDRDHDGWPLFLTSDGTYGYPNPRMGNDAIRFWYELPDDIIQATVNNGIYTLQKYGKEIIYFNVGVCDEDWVNSNISTGLIGHYYLDENVLAVMHTTTNSDTSTTTATITMIDPNTNELISEYTFPAGGSTTYDTTILGVYDGKVYAADIDANGTTVYAIDIESGNATTTDISDVYCSLENAASMTDRYICFVTGEWDECYLGLYDVSRRKSQVFSSLELPTSYLSIAPRYFPDVGVIYVADDDSNYLIYTDEDECTSVSLPRDWMGTTAVEYDPYYRRFLITDGMNVATVDLEGDAEIIISTAGRTPIGLTVLNADDDERYGINPSGEILVAYSDGILNRYEADTGEYITSVDISTYVNHATSAEFYPDYEAGYLYIEQEMLTDVISMEDWIEYAYIQNGLGHHSGTDTFYSFSYVEDGLYYLGYFRHYTLEDLIARAQTMLNGTEMSDEMRSRYGLEVESESD